MDAGGAIEMLICICQIAQRYIAEDAKIIRDVSAVFNVNVVHL